MQCQHIINTRSGFLNREVAAAWPGPHSEDYSGPTDPLVSGEGNIASQRIPPLWAPGGTSLFGPFEPRHFRGPQHCMRIGAYGCAHIFLGGALWQKLGPSNTTQLRPRPASVSNIGKHREVVEKPLYRCISEGLMQVAASNR